MFTVGQELQFQVRELQRFLSFIFFLRSFYFVGSFA